MFKKKRLLLIIILITTAFLVAGCASGYVADADAPDLEEPEVLAEVPSTAAYASDFEEEPQILASEAPLSFDSVDELLEAIGMAKFSEFAISGVRTFSIPAGVEVHGFNVLQDITALYRPHFVRHDFEAAGISVHGHGALTFHHDSAAGERANFIWARSIAAENATTDFFGRGAIAEFYVERNGITYAITEWVTPETREPDGWVVAWAQNGQAFMASLPASYTEEDVLAFCDAQAIAAWELEGNAVSVSIQGMSDVSIFEHVGDGITGFSDTGNVGNEIVAVGNTLYISGIGRSMERIGYRWLIDEATQRYQYVLRPGIFEFHVENVTGEPEFHVQHFADGNRVSSADYSGDLARRSADRLYFTVNGRDW